MKKFIISVLLFGLSFITTIKFVEADLLSIKWSVTDSNGAKMKVFNATLESKYTNSLKGGYSKWTNSTADVSISASSTTGRGVISFYEMSESAWASNGWGAGIVGWAQPMNLDKSNIYCATSPSSGINSNCGGKSNSGIV